MDWRKEFNFALEDQLFRTESQSSGQLAGLASKRMNEYHHNTANGDRRVFPVPVKGMQEYLADPRTDSVDQLLYKWNGQLGSESSQRLFYRLQQQQGRAPSKKGVGIAETFTGELVHPLDASSGTAFRRNTFMARNPNAVQQEQLEVLAARYGSIAATRQHVNTDPDTDFVSQPSKN